MELISLKGRQGLVTGSSHGIGHGIARALETAGAEVLYHSQLERPKPIPEHAPYVQADLSREGGPAELIEAAFAVFPGMDILVSNAGGFFDRPFLEMTREEWDRTINLNLRAAYFLIQAFARRLKAEQRAGSVVIVASANAFQAERDSSVYDLSKGGLVSLTRSLALDLASQPIRVNAIAPGLIRTPLTETWLNADHNARVHYEKNIPLGRIGRPEDCGGAAVFLVSEAAAYITGQTLIIDGGLTVQQIGPL